MKRKTVVYHLDVAVMKALRLPIEWTSLGWSAVPQIGDVTLHTGDPAWGWEPSAPAFAVPTIAIGGGQIEDGFTIDHVVLLVPELEAAIATLGRAGLDPRLRMPVRGRPAAFFRAGPVLEVIESPVRQASIFGIALATTGSLESLALAWKSLSLSVGSIRPAIQPGRRIMTVHGLDAGLAVMSRDGALHAEDQLA